MILLLGGIIFYINYPLTILLVTWVCLLSLFSVIESFMSKLPHSSLLSLNMKVSLKDVSLAPLYSLLQLMKLYFLFHLVFDHSIM